jgi:pyruvate dehydrogenase E2 component (dihydrolipoamide acetyltransferase)
MATILEMPRYGATMEEGLVGEWLIGEGCAVNAGEPVCTIEIEKLTNELPAPVTGILRRILLPAGDSAACGQPIAIIASADEDISMLIGGNADASPGVGGTAAGTAGAVATTGASPKTGPQATADITGRQASPSAGDTATPAAPTAARTMPVEVTPVPLGPRPITPKAARLATELGVDWSQLKGSGRLGMITRDDVRAAASTEAKTVAATPTAPQPASTTAPQPASTTAPPTMTATPPMSAMPGAARRVIAQRMMESLQQTAQASIWMDADVTDLMTVYRSVRQSLQGQGIRLSVTALIIRALARTLPDHPVCRTRIAADGRLQVMQDINIAVAVDAPGGLLVPVLRHADRKDIAVLASELTELGERARIGALTPDEMAGHTMTISNLGMYGVTYLRPVLNLPESVILGVGATQLRPVYIDGGLFPREIMPLSLTFDHRIVDGGPAAAFLRDVAGALIPALLSENTKEV